MHTHAHTSSLLIRRAVKRAPEIRAVWHTMHEWENDKQGWEAMWDGRGVALLVTIQGIDCGLWEVWLMLWRIRKPYRGCIWVNATAFDASIHVTSVFVLFHSLSACGQDRPILAPNPPPLTLLLTSPAALLYSNTNVARYWRMHMCSQVLIPISHHRNGSHPDHCFLHYSPPGAKASSDTYTTNSKAELLNQKQSVWKETNESGISKLSQCLNHSSGISVCKPPSET